MDIISFSHYTKNTLRLFHYFTQTNSKTTSFPKYFDMLYLHNLHSNMYMHPLLRIAYNIAYKHACFFLSWVQKRPEKEVIR